jgi:hypothetical protein
VNAEVTAVVSRGDHVLVFAKKHQIPNAGFGLPGQNIANIE